MLFAIQNSAMATITRPITRRQPASGTTSRTSAATMRTGTSTITLSEIREIDTTPFSVDPRDCATAGPSVIAIVRLCPDPGPLEH